MYVSVSDYAQKEREKAPVYQPDEGLEDAKKQNLEPPVIYFPAEERERVAKRFRA
jgi:hypothetical protein